MQRSAKILPAEVTCKDSGFLPRTSFFRKYVMTLTKAGLQGEYSFLKLSAFLRYQECSHPNWRAWKILSLSTCPSIVCFLISNGLPLADPSKGWRKACHYYISSWISAFIAFCCNNCELTHVIHNLRLKVWQRIAVASVQATLLVLQKLFVAIIFNIFPVPFSLIWPVFLCQFAGYRMVSYWINGNSEYTTCNMHQRLKQYSFLYTSEEFVLLLYPALATLFIYLPSNHKFWVSIILPIPKTIMLSVTHHLCRRLAPDVSGIVATTLVQFFHALFFLMCLQTSKSDIALAISIAYKVFSMVQFCAAVYRSSSKLQKQLHELITLERLQETLSSPTGENALSVRLREAKNVVDATFSIMQYDDIVRRQYSLKDVIDTVKSNRIRQLTSTRPDGPSNQLILLKSIAVGTSAQRNAFVKRVMTMLHRNEHLLLCAYIDFIVPLLYSTCIHTSSTSHISLS